VKLFVYPTDVDASAGPHVMVRGPHDRARRNDRLAELAERDPAIATVLHNGLRQGQRLLDDHVAALFGGENIILLEGHAGEAFLVDTAAIHKGLLPDKSDRLVFQALYTMLPTIKNRVSPTLVPGAYQSYADSIGHAAMPKALWRYCNWMILRDPEAEDD
jgi:hypothetical protein